MVVPFGSLVNALVVVGGGGLGMLLGNRLPDRMRESIFQALGLCTLAIGIRMTLKTGNPLYVIISVVVGAIIGEMLRLNDKMTSAGDRLKQLLRSGNTRFTDGFVAASLLFCIGSMAIIGPINEGVSGDRTLIYTKSVLDFFASIALGAAYGSGVLVSAVSIFTYQGAITLCADIVKPYLTESVQSELEAVGGILIMGIGLSLLEIKQVRLLNFLPALLIIVLVCLVLDKV